MTLVQASFCENGNSVILIADRLVSFSYGRVLEYEREGKTPKIFCYENNLVGFAGGITDILKIRNRIKDTPNVEDFSKNIFKIMKTIRDEERDRLIFLMTLWENKDDFLKNIEKIPEALKDFIYGKNSEYKINLDSLIVGFDKNEKARIFAIDNDYFYIEEETELYHYSIGSGAPFSLFYFDQEDYDYKQSLEDGLYFAYRAKKAAEAHTGVGRKTDIMILRKRKKPIIILAESKEINILEEIYNKEKNKIEEIRSNLTKELNLELVKKICKN